MLFTSTFSIARKTISGRLSTFPFATFEPFSKVCLLKDVFERYIRAVYTRENKPRLTLATAHVSRERNYLYEYKLRGQDKPRLEKAVNVDFVPFIRGVRGLRKPRLTLAAAYFLSYKRLWLLVAKTHHQKVCVFLYIGETSIILILLMSLILFQ